LSIIHEREKIDCAYTFLRALDSSYEAIRAQILLSTDNLTFEEVTTHIRQEVTRWVAKGISDSNLEPEAHDFSVHYSNAGQARSKREIERCAHCKKDDHSQERCWILNSHLCPTTRNDRNLTEVTKRRGAGAPKTLEIKRKGFVLERERKMESALAEKRAIDSIKSSR
jgi:hypothetical protein